MTDHLKTIREALEAAGVAKLADGTYLDKHCQITMALTALDALEAAMKTPVAEVAPDGVLRFWTTARKFEVGSKLYMDAPPAQQTNEWREAVLDKLAEHCIDAPIDEPPASILGRIIEVAVQMATDPRINPPAQQAQRPDFHDEWAGYLKDGETPFERFTRERKDLTSLTKLYQRALEENERLKAQQPRQCGLCGSDEAFTGTCGGGRRDPRALCYEPVAQQPQAKRTWLTDPRQTKERQFAEFLNDRRNMNVSAVFHDLMGKFAALTAPQQAEAVPPGYVLVPIEPTKKMVDAGGFVKIEVTYTYAGYVDVHIGDDAARNAYRAMIAAAQGEKP